MHCLRDMLEEEEEEKKQFPKTLNIYEISLFQKVFIYIVADLQISKSPMGPTKKSGEAL